jgi:hypothetical protein
LGASFIVEVQRHKADGAGVSNAVGQLVRLSLQCLAVAAIALPSMPDRSGLGAKGKQVGNKLGSVSLHSFRTFPSRININPAATAANSSLHNSNIGLKGGVP